MKRLLIGSLLVTGLFVGCGDDEGSTPDDEETSGPGGGSSAGACGTECATTACADSSPDQACGDCAEAQCGAEISACIADAGTCGSSDCSSCGALLSCDECSDQLDLDAEGKMLFDAILTCLCG